MDVIDIAKQRRSNLAREMAKLDEFIRMGEELRKNADTRPTGEAGTQPAQAASGASAGQPAAQTATPNGQGGGQPNMVRQFAASGSPAKG